MRNILLKYYSNSFSAKESPTRPSRARRVVALRVDPAHISYEALLLIREFSTIRERVLWITPDPGASQIGPLDAEDNFDSLIAALERIKHRKERLPGRERAKKRKDHRTGGRG